MRGASISQIFVFPILSFDQSPVDTIARKNLPGEGAASEWCATTIHPEWLKSHNLLAKHLEKSGGEPALSDSPVLHGDPGSPGGLDSLGLACMAVDADTKEVEPSGVDAYERRGALPIVCAAPALAEGTAGVEPASEAERAMAAKFEALASWVRGETRREVERLPMHEPPQKGRRKLEALPPKGDVLPLGRPNKRQTQEWT